MRHCAQDLYLPQVQVFPCSRHRLQIRLRHDQKKGKTRSRSGNWDLPALCPWIGRSDRSPLFCLGNSAPFRLSGTFRVFGPSTFHNGTPGPESPSGSLCHKRWHYYRESAKRGRWCQDHHTLLIVRGGVEGCKRDFGHLEKVWIGKPDSTKSDRFYGNIRSPTSRDHSTKVFGATRCHATPHVTPPIRPNFRTPMVSRTRPKRGDTVTVMHTLVTSPCTICAYTLLDPISDLFPFLRSDFIPEDSFEVSFRIYDEIVHHAPFRPFRLSDSGPTHTRSHSDFYYVSPLSFLIFTWTHLLFILPSYAPLVTLVSTSTCYTLSISF
jgi:hypothetical protein